MKKEVLLIFLGIFVLAASVFVIAKPNFVSGIILQEMKFQFQKMQFRFLKVFLV